MEDDALDAEGQAIFDELIAAAKANKANRAPTGLTEKKDAILAWVPEGWHFEWCCVHEWTGHGGAPSSYRVQLLKPFGGEIQGTGPTPELAVADAAKKVKP